MSSKSTLRPGSRVLVPWGLGAPRTATVVEVWGDPKAPTHVRVELDSLGEDDEAAVLLLSPETVTPAA